MLKKITILALAALFSIPLILGSLYSQQMPRFRIKEVAARDNFKKGQSFFNAQQYVAAREFFYKALDINPSFHLARRFLGDSFYYAGEWNSALEQWEYLTSLSGNAYPLVKQRSELLRFYFNQHQNPGEFIFLDSYNPSTWRAYDFQYPVDVGFDGENNIYLLSYKTAGILKIVPGGKVEREITGPFWERLKGPAGMHIHRESIYVADYVGDQIFQFDLTGSLIKTFGETGSGPGQFRGPSGVMVLGDNIYVTDAGNRRIQKFDMEGNFKLEFGADSRGNRPELPTAMTHDEKRRIYVADNTAGKIISYDEFGNYLTTITSRHIKKPRGLSITGELLLVADEREGIFFYDLREQVWTKLKNIRNSSDRLMVFNRPFAVRMDNNGILYGVEYGSHKLNILVPQGLRISNLDVKIQKIDTRSYPDLAAFVSIKNRLQRPVLGLSRSEIKLFENDYLVRGIKTDNIKVFNSRTNLVLLKENSQDFRKNYDQYMKNIAWSILEPIKIADKVKVVRISNDVRLVHEGLQRREIIKILTSGDLTKNPALGKGLYESITRLLPEIGPRTVIFFTAGKDIPGAFNQYSQERIIHYARANDINLYIISFESEKDPRKAAQLNAAYRRMAYETGGKYYNAFDETDLKNIYQDFREKIDRRYIITWHGKSEEWLSGRYVDVRIDVDYMKTFGRGDGGYFVPEK